MSSPIAPSGDPCPVFWAEGLVRPGRPALDEPLEADVAIAGGGFTGLWTAIEIRRRAPLSVALFEAGRLGAEASGRNGGYLDPSLTHGLANGARHFPREIRILERLALDSYHDLLLLFERHAVDCDFEPTGMLEVATSPHQIGPLREWAELHERHGHEAEFLDRDRVQRVLASPAFLAGVRRPRHGGILNPARLVLELGRLAEELGARLYEQTPVTRIEDGGRGGVVLRAGGFPVRARHAVVATNISAPGLARDAARRFIPVYEYNCVTAPLDDTRLASLGWSGREGASDFRNQMLAFRLTRDDRIFFGGHDAIYHYGSRTSARWIRRAGSVARLRRLFESVFPALGGVPFTHAWGGVIGVSSRFTPVFGASPDGRVQYVVGYTGLGLATAKFAARVAADRILDPGSPILELDFVRRPPLRFPTEPWRWLGVQLMKRALAREDRSGHRGPLLRLLDRLGVGFAS